MVAERRSADLNAIRFVDMAIAGMASTGLLAPAALRLRVRRLGQPSVSISICRVAVLGGSPHQITLSRSSKSEL